MYSRPKPSNSREMKEIVTCEELWDIGNTFYVNDLVGYSLQKHKLSKNIYLFNIILFLIKNM